jgi:hypothetical protein
MKSQNFFRYISIFLMLIACSSLFGFTGVTAAKVDQFYINPDSYLIGKDIVQEPPFPIYIPLVMRDGSTLYPSSYYVSPQGNDSNPGTFLLPWKSIRKAADSVSPGSRIFIRSGIYHEYISIHRSGTESLPILFTAYPGETPVLDGENTLPNTEEGLFSINGDWVEVSGLEVKNSNYMGISLYGKHNTVTNVYVHNSWRNGIYMNGDYGTVQDSRVWRNSMHNEFGVDTGSSGIAASRDEVDGITDYAIIRRNVVWENWGQGINIHHAKYVTVEQNTSFDNFTANIYIHDLTNVLCQQNFFYMNPNNSYMGNLGPKVGILMGEEYSPPIAENIQVINNIVYGNHMNLFWYSGNMGGGMTNVLFANNSFVNGMGDSSGGNCNVVFNPAVNSNVRFENNLVMQENTIPVIGTVVQSGVSYSHNLWSKTPVTAARGSGDVIGDPKLAKIGQPYSVDWFRLTASSPALNAASFLPEVALDFFGKIRGGSPDLGAIEYIP